MNWRKSSHSNPNGACIEVGNCGNLVVIRDTKQKRHPGTVLKCSPGAWREFTEGIKEN